MSRRVVRELDELVAEHKAKDTFGGYDWGDPIRLWSAAGRPQFDDRQLAIARRALELRELERVGGGQL